MCIFHPGSRLIFMPRSPELYFIMLGAIKIGAIAGPLFEAFMEGDRTDFYCAEHDKVKLRRTRHENKNAVPFFHVSIPSQYISPLFEAFMEGAVKDRLLNSQAKVVVTTPELAERIIIMNDFISRFFAAADNENMLEVGQAVRRNPFGQFYFIMLGAIKIGAIAGPLFEAFMEGAVKDRLLNNIKSRAFSLSRFIIMNDFISRFFAAADNENMLEVG
jgi:acyl-coenzyme A synthetase/AMP-(fatty) acid ligase